jgi:nucleoside-diphosphate-sugar epimerase
MDIKIFLLSNKTSFSIFLDECLKEDAFETNFTNKIKQETLEDNIVIVNLLEPRNEIDKEIEYILQSKCQKIILLINAMDLYLNCKNKPPFSVYCQLESENEISLKLLEIEKKIVNSNKKYVIFRITDIYGPSITETLINQLFVSKKQQLENTKHDFIYEGDVVQAIEIALKQNVVGLFDIASGQTINLREISDLIIKTYKIPCKIKWKRKKQELNFNCENFKFYGWDPLVNIQMGLKTIFTTIN